MTTLVVFSRGDSEVRRINSIDFSRATYCAGPGGRAVKTYRIGNAKVSAWLYELVLAQALELEGRKAPSSAVTVTRGADGVISIEGKSR